MKAHTLDPSNDIIDASYKGYPAFAQPMRLSEIGKQGWNLINGDLPFPVAILRASALKNNSHWMQQFLKASHVSIAPHGKTTMAPQLFATQMQDGAWGITVATVQQAYVCWLSGIRRLFMANQLIAPADIQSILHLLKTDPLLDFYCLIDSIHAAETLNTAALESKLAHPIKVLVELGFPGGRTGCRSVEEGLKLANHIRNFAGLQLVGIECYEGIINHPIPEQCIAQVELLLDAMLQLATFCDENNLFVNTSEIILSAGGSSYFDLVVKAFQAIRFRKPHRIIIRSGCYLTHDSTFQEKMFQQIQKRLPVSSSVNFPFIHALEVWSVVQSRPEPHLAILSIGKRDASYDMDLPVPCAWFSRENAALTTSISEWNIFQLNDQHAYMRIPEQSTLAVGDYVGCGISHPCTTFDKWKLIYMTSDDYTVMDAVKTYF